jgi:hypothetical protein
MQEAALAMDSPAERVRRRVRYWLLDKLPVKYRLFDRVINAQHEIDPLDLELARTAEANAGRRVAAAGAGG